MARSLLIVLGCILKCSAAWPYRCPASANASATISGLVDGSGMVAVVTGADGHIGREITRSIAITNATVVMSCRTEDGCNQAAQELRAELGASAGVLETLVMDLGEFESVSLGAKQLLGRHGAIHVLVNNAGCVWCSNKTGDGWVGTVQINHLSHALLTKLLLPALTPLPDARKPRVVSTGSANCYGPIPASSGAPMNLTADPRVLLEWSRDSSILAPVLGYYSLSKFLIAQWHTELARRHPWLVSFSANPGFSGRSGPGPACPTDIKFRPCPQSFAQSATGVVFSALMPGEEVEAASGGMIDFKTVIQRSNGSLGAIQSGDSCVPRPLPGWLSGSRVDPWADADRERWYDAVDALFG